MIQLGFDGKRKSTETFSLKLKRVPAWLSGQAGDVCTVGEFTIQSGDQLPARVRKLPGWSYVFREMTGAKDEKGQVLGILMTGLRTWPSATAEKFLVSPVIRSITVSLIFTVSATFLPGRSKGVMEFRT